MKIFKYYLNIQSQQEIRVPVGARVLTVQVQQKGIVLWALVDEKASLLENRKIGLYGTGHVLPSNLGDYIATVQTFNGDLVWHVFDMGAVSNVQSDNNIQ